MRPVFSAFFASPHLNTSNEVNHTMTLFQALGFRGTPALIVMPTQHPTADNIHVIFGADPVQIKQAIAQVKQSVQER